MHASTCARVIGPCLSDLTTPHLIMHMHPYLGWFGHTSHLTTPLWFDHTHFYFNWLHSFDHTYSVLWLHLSFDHTFLIWPHPWFDLTTPSLFDLTRPLCFIVRVTHTGRTRAQRRERWRRYCWRDRTSRKRCELHVYVVIVMVTW